MSEEVRYRNASVQLATRAEGDDDAPTRLTATLATGDPVRVHSFWGDSFDEVLKMTRGAVNLSRLRNEAPFLANHNNDVNDIMGRIEKPRLEDGQLRADIELFDTPQSRAYADLLSQGLRGKISIGFSIEKSKMTRKATDDEVAEVTVERWTPMEASAVAVPADDGARVTAYRSFFDPTERSKAMPDPVVEPQTEPAPAVDEAAIRAAAVAEVRQNDAVLRRMGDDYESRNVPGSAQLAQRAIDEGKSQEWLAEELNKALMDDHEKLRADNPRREKAMEIGLTEKETRRFSFQGLVRHLADPGNASLRDAAGFEIAAAKAAMEVNARSGVPAQTGQYAIPMDVMVAPLAFTPEQRAVLGYSLRAPGDGLQVGVGGTAPSAGGDNLVQTILATGSFIEILRNRSAILGRVFRMAGLVGNVDIPKRIGTVSPDWEPEANTTPKAATKGNFGKVQLRPHKLSVKTPISHTSLIQTTPGAEMLMRMDIIDSIALKCDAGGLDGDGTGENPLGILRDTNTLSLTGSDTNGIDLKRSFFTGLQSLVGEKNASNPDSCFLCDEKMRWKAADTLLAGTTAYTDASYIWPERADRPGGRAPAIVSNQVPRATRGSKADTGTLVYFSPMQVIHASWGTPVIQVDPYSDWDDGFVTLKLFQHDDFALRHSESLAKRPYINP